MGKKKTESHGGSDGGTIKILNQWTNVKLISHYWVLALRYARQ